MLLRLLLFSIRHSSFVIRHFLFPHWISWFFSPSFPKIVALLFLFFVFVSCHWYSDTKTDGLETKNLKRKTEHKQWEGEQMTERAFNTYGKQMLIWIIWFLKASVWASWTSWIHGFVLAKRKQNLNFASHIIAQINRKFIIFCGVQIHKRWCMHGINHHIF